MSPTSPTLKPDSPSTVMSVLVLILFYVIEIVIVIVKTKVVSPSQELIVERFNIRQTLLAKKLCLRVLGKK
jgi:hypothetical protein